MTRRRAYEQVWDSIDKKWKTPEEITYDIMHDKPRFISEKPNNMGDGGVILAFYRSTSRKCKNGKTCPVRAHFKPLKSYKLNTYENRRTLKAKQASRESEIHKLCKELFMNGNIKTIHVQERKVPVVIGNSTEYLRVKEQDIEVLGITAVEKKDCASNRIPDIIINAKINNIVQQFFIEIYYSHPVDQYKRYSYIENKINCIEIDVGNIYEEDANKNLKDKLIYEISNNAHWISCNIEEWIKDGIKQYYNILNTSTILRKTKLDIINEYNMVYVFEDELILNGGNRPYKKTHSIGDCLKCARCIGAKGYHSGNTDDIEILCSKNEIPKDIDNNGKILLIKKLVSRWIARYADNINQEV